MLRNAIAIGISALLVGAPAMGEGLYIGTGIGVTQIDDEEGRDGIALDDSPAGWRLIAGFEFGEYFAFEAAYVVTGDVNGTLARAGIDFPDPIDFETDFSALTISVIGTLPMSNSAGLFGKLGYFDGQMDLDLSPFGVTDDIEESGISAGGGIKWELTENFVIRSEIDWYDTDVDTIWSIGVGVQYSLDL